MVGELDGTEATFGRRRFVAGAIGAATAGGVAGSLAWPHASPARTDRGDAPLPEPKPIPGGIQIPDGPLLHVFVPGPETVTLPFTGLTLQGLNTEPSTITDFRGFTALAYVVGTATDNEGRAYNLEADIRAYQGAYIAANGSRRFGHFGFI
jgi:hypothetical protein